MSSARSVFIIYIQLWIIQQKALTSNQRSMARPQGQHLCRDNIKLLDKLSQQISLISTDFDNALPGLVANTLFYPFSGSKEPSS